MTLQYKLILLHDIKDIYEDKKNISENRSSLLTCYIPASYTGVQDLNLGTETSYDVRSEVLTAVKMSMFVSSVVTPCSLVGRYKRFDPTKRWCLPTNHGVTTVDTVCGE
jgi:hypothetical protein